jgi:hypothetical protein
MKVITFVNSTVRFQVVCHCSAKVVCVGMSNKCSCGREWDFNGNLIEEGWWDDFADRMAAAGF